MKSKKSDLGKIQFVHCAMPNMALSEADTRYTISERIELPFPIAVMVDSERLAKYLSTTSRNIPFVSSNSIYLNGNPVRLKSSHIVEVGDGLEAGKAIRVDSYAIPSIKFDFFSNFDTYIKQLRIAMFLTNSRNISELKKANIYKVR